MPFAPGTILGPYEILSPLGAGGMGEVYRARDKRLDRTVAIKVLPERLSQNSDLRQRLDREARTISKLSHPNICTLHDVGQQDGTDYLVMEFVEGKTLRELIKSGILPIRKVIAIAVQVAEGLAQAHESNIVHRDLKPENLIVSGEIVKILDFGLAKLGTESLGQTSKSATALELTERGEILGTFRYMSPEQASGRTLDFRSDQFSFGLLLYEMAAGRHPFQRDSPTQTLLAIVRDEPPPIASLNPQVPPPLCWVIERCLVKEPEKRYFSTRDLVRDLTAIRDRLSDLQSSPPPSSRQSNLPVSTTAFIGREKELAAVKQLLLRDDIRLLTITGPGGIGKSRLAIELAREVSDQFPSGTHFIALASVTNPSLIALTIAQALGVRETVSLAPLDALTEYFRNSRNEPMLVVIDNFEHLLSSAPMLADLLTLTPNLKLVVTSRAPLHVYSEQEFPLLPLAMPESRTLPALKVLGKYPAISLFVQRAAAVKPGFELGEENASAVAEICARLDGLPLAIELAAARIKLLSPSAMRTRLASCLQLLTGGARDLPARQQTLRQTIDWSYDLLNEPEQKLFRRLSVFVGGCTLDSVESVCDTKMDLGLGVLDGMSSMVDKNLIRQVEQPDGEPRFTMLETIREYALEKIGLCGERETTKRAHAAYCLVLAEEGASQKTDAAQSDWLRRFDIEHDNFRAALDWLTETENAEWGLRLGIALFRFWDMREHLTEGRARLGKLLRLQRAAAHPNSRIRCLFAAGVLASLQGDYADAGALIQESLKLARQWGDRRSTAVSLNALAVNARDQGDLAVSHSLFQESLALWTELNDEPALARGLSNLARVSKLRGDYVAAGLLYDQCLAIFRNLGDDAGLAWTLNHQGDAASENCDFAVARSLYERSLARFGKLNDRWGIAGTLLDLGNLARDQGDYSTADSLYREGLGVFQELEHKRGVARALESFACSASSQTQAERALRLAGAAAALRQSIGTPLTPAEQAKLDRGLELARQSLTTTVGRSAWLEGWVMPIEQAIEDVLKPTNLSPPREHLK